MAGEDFAFYLDHRPGASVWIGNGALREGAELHGPTQECMITVYPG